MQVTSRQQGTHVYACLLTFPNHLQLANLMSVDHDDITHKRIGGQAQRLTYDRHVEVTVENRVTAMKGSCQWVCNKL